MVFERTLRGSKGGLIRRLTGSVKREKASDPPKSCDVPPELRKAAQVAEQYSQLSLCCSILSKLSEKAKAPIGALTSPYVPYSNYYAHLSAGGFRCSAEALDNAGIDMEEVHAHIRKLVLKRKLELELALRDDFTK